MSQRTTEDAPRLPPPAPIRAIASATGPVLLRPWFDRVTLRWLAQWYFPLSRGWAAALAAEGSAARFAELVGADGLPQDSVRALLDLVARRWRAYAEAVAAWQAAFFEAAGPTAAELVRAERARQRAAHNLMAARTGVFPVRLRRKLPPVAFDMPGPEAMRARHGERLDGGAPAFPAPPAAAPEASHGVAGGYGRISWLRWPSPLGDTAWARVYTPFGAGDDAPTFIFLHGVAMEPEMWREVTDPVNAMAAWAGVRVIRAEGPWHGRRRLAGFYGGEPVLARGPDGLVELMRVWVAEAGQLVAWARRTSTGPVALGGLSLGALTSQVAAAAARDWPEAARPDALFLSVTSGDMLGVGYEGSLARALGLPEAVRARGWDADKLREWLPLLEPQGPPAMPGGRIVMLLGRNDTVTPYEGGRRLARAWDVPRANLFVWPKGHFTAPLGLYRDDGPLKRLVALLRGAEPGPA